jgi:hypothetical protein
MSEWIKARITLHQDPIVVKQAAALGRTTYEIAYAWIVVWGWARGHTADGFVRDVDQTTIDAIAGIPAFAQHAGRWMEFASEGVTFPYWDRHNSNGARERAQANERKAASRTSRHGDVTLVSRSCPENVTVERDKNGTRREEKRRETTTTTTTSVIARAEAPAEKADGGGGGGEIHSGDSKAVREALAAIPTFVSQSEHLNLARRIVSFATTFAPVSVSDVAHYLASLAAGSSPNARPGKFTNLVKAGADSIDRDRLAKYVFGRRVHEAKQWLAQTDEGKAHWASVYTDKVKATFRDERTAMEHYAQRMVKQQEGAA